MIQDPYAVLGVSPGCSEDEVKSAYRRLAKQYHPDLHPDDPAAAARMNEINAAYEQIKNGGGQQSNPYSQAYGSTAEPQWQQDAWTHYAQSGHTYYYRTVQPGGCLLRFILFFLLLRLIGSILFGALLGGYSFAYEAPRDGSSPGYYYYYYYPGPDQPESAPETNETL